MPKQDVAVELYYDGAWHDITADDDVFTSTPIVVKRGQGDESAAPRPAQISMQLANDDDMYRTSNPVSPLYGKAGRNTPVRVAVAGVVRGVVEASSWSAEQTRDFRPAPRRGKAWVDVEGGGLLQRIGQWSETLRSPMTRQALSYTSLTGLWPLEDPSEATVLSQLVPGIDSGTFSGGVDLGQEETPAGAEASAQLGTGGRLRGVFAPSTASGWQLVFAVRLPAHPSSATYQTLFTWTDSLLRTWQWRANDTNFRMTVTDSAGATLEDVTSSNIALGQWVRFRIKATVSGGTLTYEPAWYAQDASVIAGYTGTFSAASTGQPLFWQVDANTWTEDGWYAGVFGVDDATLELLLDYAAIASFNGYAGETAGERFDRLCNELGLTGTIIGTAADSTPMGPQRADTFPNHLQEIQTTEDGLIFDTIDEIGLTILLRAARYNQTPALALAPGDLPALPKEVTDDLDPHNIVTVSQRDGGEATARDDTGPLGTQSPPDGIGEYRQTVDVNLDDETSLPQVAAWWLRRGTVDLPRFPQVTVNLAALDAVKIAEVEAVDVGSVITIDGFREYTIRLVVLGYTEVIGTTSRAITFTCVPDQQFQVGVLDDTARWDSASTTLGAAAGIADTQLELSTVGAGDLWTVTTAPFDLLCAGQRSTLRWMSNAGSLAELEGGFETGLDGWDTSTSTAVARSTAYQHAGAASAEMTATGSPTSMSLFPTVRWPVVAGQSYTAVCWVYAAAPVANMRLTISWYDVSDVFISTSSTSLVTADTTWQQLTVTATAPVGAVSARPIPNATSSPPMGTVFYVDDVDLVDDAAAAASPYVQQAWVTRGVDGITKQLPAGAPVHVATPGRWAL